MTPATPPDDSDAGELVGAILLAVLSICLALVFVTALTPPA